MTKILSLMTVVGLIAALPAAAEMMEPPAPAGEVQVTELRATVEDVDLANRLVTLKGPKGGTVVVEAGPEVQDLEQIQVGDEIVARRYLAIVVSAVQVDADAQRKKTVLAEGAAIAKDYPAGVYGREVAETIEILDIDPYKTSIAFRDARGHYREVSMKAPHLEGRMDDFKKGDMVEVVYREGMAVALDPQ
jgi:Cu/Ag efflux protein CusF